MKPQKPKILKVVRTDAFVKIRQESSRSSEQKNGPDPDKPGETKTKTVTSSSEFEETAHEAPLPAFDEALQALADAVVNVMELGQGYKKGLTVTGIALSYTNSNVRTAVISFVKEFNATSSSHPMKTQAFQIDDGKKADDGRRQCAKKHAEAIVDFIKQAQRYAAGERSQQLLKFEEESTEKDDGQGKIVGIEEGGED